MLLDNSSVNLTQFLHKIIEKSLFQPAFELDKRSKKKLRSELVSIAFNLICEEHHFQTTADFLGQLIESLHTGSLIIDDIQDNSIERRSGPCVHIQYGVPLSINAGNWLYFSTFHQIGRSHLLTEQQKFSCFQSINNVMYWAHIGQAIDIGAQIEFLSPSETVQVCEKSLLLKSGYLAGLSFELGAIAAHANSDTQKKMFDFGCQFGILLQKFDDIGNARFDSLSVKKFEDLLLMRPSWIWSCAHQFLSPEEFIDFKKAIKLLPTSDQMLTRILKETQLLKNSHVAVAKEIDEWMVRLTEDFSISENSENYKNLNTVRKKLINAYT